MPFLIPLNVTEHAEVQAADTTPRAGNGTGSTTPMGHTPTPAPVSPQTTAIAHRNIAIPQTTPHRTAREGDETHIDPPEEMDIDRTNDSSTNGLAQDQQPQTQTVVLTETE